MPGQDEFRSSGSRARGAIDVDFSRLADQNGESSSQADSQSSRGGKSSASESRQTATPDIRSSPGHRVGRSGGFLLGSVFANGRPLEKNSLDRHGKRRAHNGQIHVQKRHDRAPRLSTESSLGNSPLSREISSDHSTTPSQNVQNRDAPPPHIMDPAQLVQMALDLSESRRRHTSAPIHVPLTLSPGGGRIGTRLGSSYADTRSKHNTQGSPSLSEDTPQSSPASRGLSQTYDLSLNDEHEVTISERSDFAQTFSPATLSRAEKARRYFELADQHRRLLAHLPPLKPDATAPGNFHCVTTSSTGSAQVQITRVPSHVNHKHALGRPYNPLQTLRNRRLRARERRPYTAPPEAWLDTEKIKGWIDHVETATSSFDYRGDEDKIQLPSYPGDGEGRMQLPENAKRHRRSDTANSVITRPENGWTVEPSESLADTYWTEKGNNKAFIENRNGDLIFPSLGHRRVETVPRSQNVRQALEEAPKLDGDIGDDRTEKPTRRRTHLLPRKLQRAARASRSASISSSSSAGKRAPAGDENIGPLERHMREMISKEESGELPSPDLISPDHWDSRRTAFPAFRENVHRRRRSSLISVDGQGSVDIGSPQKRAKSADNRLHRISNALSSSDDLNSPEEPNSPAIAGFIPSLGMDLVPPTSPKREKSRNHLLPALWTHDKGRDNGIDHTDFADNKLASNQDITQQPRSSQESARPSFMHRHRTTESWSGSLRRHETNTTSTTAATSTKEPPSVVGRFLKSGRIGDLVRHEKSSRLGKPFRYKDKPGDSATYYDTPRAVSDHSDAEDAGSVNGRSGNDSDQSPRTSFDRSRAKPRYHLPNLPSFKSPSARNKAQTMDGSDSLDSDHISRQQRIQREIIQPSRFSRLAPPRISLPIDDDESAKNSYLAANRSDNYLHRHPKSYGFLNTGSESGSRNDITSTETIHWRDPSIIPLAGPSRFSKAQAQRQWSISDKIQPQKTMVVSTRDVAHVKALLLSSGIKAREIQKQANNPRDVPLPVYQRAMESIGKTIGSVPRKEEHVVVAHLLSDDLASTCSKMDTALETFQSKTTRALSSELDELRQKAADQLTKLLLETSDEADAFTVQLTTKQPQDVKRIDDAIDDMLKQRRRQFRLLRRTGFKLLEWTVLGIMWWIWFVVMLVNTGRKTAVGIFSFVRWLIWF